MISKIPVEDILSRAPIGEGVKARIRKLYPTGLADPYSKLKGWHPHHSFRRCINMDVVPVSAFINKFGRSAYRALPKEALVRSGHRKAVSATYFYERGRNA